MMQSDCTKNLEVEKMRRVNVIDAEKMTRKQMEEFLMERGYRNRILLDRKLDKIFIIFTVVICSAVLILLGLALLF